MCPLVTDEVDNDLNDSFDTLDLQADIDDNCYIDYSLVQPPFVIQDALFINGKGEALCVLTSSQTLKKYTQWPPNKLESCFDICFTGEIFDKAHPTECPSPKQDMPETVDSDRMVTLWITEYMLNTAGYAYQDAGFLQYNLTNDDVSYV